MGFVYFVLFCVFVCVCSILGNKFVEIGFDFDGVCKKFDEDIGENGNEEVGIDLVGRREIFSISKYEFFFGNIFCEFIEEF